MPPHFILMKILDRLHLNQVVDELRNDGVVAFPTDTVYGLGANAYSDSAVAKIFQYKNRPSFNPISVCYPNLDRAESDVEINKFAMIFAEKFLPGALTLVLKRKDTSKISWLCSAGKETIGIRVPNNNLAIELLEKLDFPLAAPSANRSSELSTTSAQEVMSSLSNATDLTILDGGLCSLGIESTIVDLSDNDIKILRQGAISVEEIADKCGVDPKLCLRAEAKHYYPKKQIIMNCEDVKENDALLAFGQPIAKTKYCLNLSESENLTEAAQNFFSMLRKLDNTNADRICVMSIPSVGIGCAINDRLKRSV